MRTIINTIQVAHYSNKAPSLLTPAKTRQARDCV